RHKRQGVSPMQATMNLASVQQLTARPLSPFGLVLEAGPDRQDLRDLPADELLRLTRKHRVLVLRGLRPMDRQTFSDWCSGWGELLEWPFGTVLDVIVHDTPKNYLFTNGSVPFHWDGAFARTVPGFLVFQCLQALAAGTGGETTFCDTTRAWKGASPEQR